MRKRLLFVAALLNLSALTWAQEPTTSDTEKALKDEAASFIFTETQLDEDADVTQDVIQINSSTNLYTSNVGYLFSPMRFKFRALDQKYNDIFMNGVQVNSAENGRFSYSTIGGMNDATRSIDYASPFESNTFGMPQRARLGILWHRGLSVGKHRDGGRRGNLLQLARLLPLIAEEMGHTAQLEHRHLGQPHRTRPTGCIDRRSILARQQLSLQPLLGFPER